MKKLLLLLLITINCFSQRIAINKIDEFTNEKIIKIDTSEGNSWSGSDNIVTGFLNNVFLCNSAFLGKDNTIISTFTIYFGSMTCSNPDNKLILLLEDNSKIILTQISKTDCNYEKLIIQYSTGPSFSEQLNNINILSKFSVNKIRFYSNDNYYDFTVKDKKKELIKKSFQLLLNEIKEANITSNTQN